MELKWLNIRFNYNLAFHENFFYQVNLPLIKPRQDQPVVRSRHRQKLSKSHLIGQQAAALVPVLGSQRPLAQHVVGSDLNWLGQPAVKQGAVQWEGLWQACREGTRRNKLNEGRNRGRRMRLGQSKCTSTTLNTCKTFPLTWQFLTEWLPSLYIIDYVFQS